MDYPKYIVDWQNRELEEEEYGETDKYAFSLLNVSRELLSHHLDTFDMEPNQRESLKIIGTLLERAYEEKSHLEMSFDDKYRIT